MRFFNPWSEIDFTLNRLPHWQQDGAVYFVTWRLADSLPRTLLARHQEEISAWRTLHPFPWDAATEQEYHRRFSARLDAWLDEGQGACLLRDAPHAEKVASALRHFEGRRSAMISFIVMPNHVHALFSLHADWRLQDLVHSWKRHSAREINRLRGRSGPVWQKDYFDRLVRDSRHFARCVRYIRGNPAKARLKPSECFLHESDLARQIL